MGELFTHTELVEAEVLRQHIAAQIPGQIDIWDACAEVEGEPAEGGYTFPTPPGVLFDAVELRGQLVIA